MSTDTLPRTRMLNCGHYATPSGYSPGLAYIAFPGSRGMPTDAGYVMCYRCDAADTLGYWMTIQDRITLYLSPDDQHVMTWTGWIIGRVTRRTVGRTRINVQVRDNNGRMWHGVAPVANGTYVTLCAYKGR